MDETRPCKRSRAGGIVAPRKTTSTEVQLTILGSIYDALTPEERVAQICATSAGNLAGSDGRFSAEKARARIPHGIGHVCQFACNRTDEPESLAQFVRDVQAFCLNETRAGIPAICHEEVISGLAARTALGSEFDNTIAAL